MLDMMCNVLKWMDGRRERREEAKVVDQEI